MGAALAYGLVAGFGSVGALAYALITGLAVAGIVIGVLLPQRAAASEGAAPSSIRVGALLAVAGSFVVPVIGVVLGGVPGVPLGEFVRTRDSAWHAIVATVKGFGIAAVVQVLLGRAMVAVWVLWVVLG